MNSINRMTVAVHAVNYENLVRIQESGSAVSPQTILHGDFALRVCITNHRTKQQDLDQLARDVVMYGREVGEEKR